MAEPKTMKDVRNDPDHIRQMAANVALVESPDDEGTDVLIEAFRTMRENADYIEQLREALEFYTGLPAEQCISPISVNETPSGEQR